MAPPPSLEEVAKSCLEGLAGDRAAWGLPWSATHEFIAVVTRIADNPTPLGHALEFVESLLRSGSCVPLAEPAGYFDTLKELAIQGHAGGTLIFDARIAATCLLHGVRELWAVDRDFGRFPALRTSNPLIA